MKRDHRGTLDLFLVTLMQSDFIYSVLFTLLIFIFILLFSLQYLLTVWLFDDLCMLRLPALSGLQQFDQAHRCRKEAL